MTALGTGMNTSGGSGNRATLLTVGATSLLGHVLRKLHRMANQGALVIATLKLTRTLSLAGAGLGVPAGPGGHLMTPDAGDNDSFFAPGMGKSLILVL